MNLKNTISAHEFWQYSLQYYSLSNNQYNLLYLQDNAALNVNSILLLLYLQTKNVFIYYNQFNDLISRIKKLDSLTSNFREKRREIKALNLANGMADFRTIEYQDLLQQELELEKQQQAILVCEIVELRKKGQNAAESKDHEIMDVKAYLIKLTRGRKALQIKKIETIFDELILEQIKLSKTFGQNLNE